MFFFAIPFEQLEMQVVSNKATEGDTPPVGCSSRNSVIETPGVCPPLQSTAIGKNFFKLIANNLMEVAVYSYLLYYT